MELNEVLPKRLAVCLLAVLCLAGIAPSRAAIRPVTGDWHGDLSANLALWNDATPRALLDANEDGRVAGLSPERGVAGDSPIAGDWNADGIDTLALYRPSTGRLYVYNSNTRLVTPA